MTCHDGRGRAVPVFWTRRDGKLVARVAKRTIIMTVIGASDPSDHRCRLAADSALHAAAVAIDTPELVRSAASPTCGALF